MVRDEEYINFLESMISCINYGDYYSVKELSYLELEKMKKKIKSEKLDNTFNTLRKNKKKDIL